MHQHASRNSVENNETSPAISYWHHKLLHCGVVIWLYLYMYTELHTTQHYLQQCYCTQTLTKNKPVVCGKLSHSTLWIVEACDILSVCRVMAESFAPL